MGRYPWEGQARPMSAGAFDDAGRKYRLDPDIIRAVWQVESAGRGFRSDGTLERRYEPHHFPGSGITSWRESLKIKTARRDQMLREAYDRKPEAALDATSFGGPQIMGFNAEAAGYRSAMEMVTAMAADENEHLAAFLRLVDGWGLITVLAAHDWHRFASRYNGSGQAAVYAEKIETAYRRLTGRASPVVLRLGRASDKAAVKELQRALGIEDDGVFGRDTDAAVRAFQERYGLTVDGVVGDRTWAMLRDRRDASPSAQPARADGLAKITGYSGAATALAGAVATIGDALPDNAMTIVAAGASIAGVMALGAILFVKIRDGKALF
ncbi:N-acetylmuramidase domain-containing protein [Paracoccus sp. Z330]|uniref:N-acetylmuramidase domain-containing protein n=1 Tax=Paracoccus onchidii TaxID=3017813 RepID=A0ABT4ZJ68_9RHOB|nr:N-acetylmuramidase domain-containing protein [Paracoccus onchidii]MDB6179018.1 N-acetylmuramidase domain-containing protein [Paracoccus onchidii]